MHFHRNATATRGGQPKDWAVYLPFTLVPFMKRRNQGHSPEFTLSLEVLPRTAASVQSGGGASGLRGDAEARSSSARANLRKAQIGAKRDYDRGRQNEVSRAANLVSVSGRFALATYC